MIKRIFDVIAAFTGLIVLAPVMVVIALLIRWRMGAPVLFLQERPGLHGLPFVMCKFRTMRDTKDANGAVLPDAGRLTALGRFLRSTSLDELPELWNVLKGEMSLVGPRPLLMSYLPLYSPEQFRRHELRPGMTGWAQVNGRNSLIWEERLAMDTWYVDHRSFRLDIRILLLTVRKVLQREGISGHGHATMAPFTGNRPPSDRS
ncbi:sugar transferase [Aidingimonas lacisalsi]|uniref:sugar transferase n=1 Tax=Aidingimonas lacisalsi TaxID=2604086 RepID=UPI00191C1AB5|nr:sugar transferase [Aidingimonas lacisalsi]